MNRTRARVILCTFIAAANDDFIHMVMSGLLQSVQEAAEHISRLVHDNVNQLFSCLDGLAMFRLNGLQLLQCNRVTLKHVASDALGFQFLGHFRVYATQHISVT